MAASASTTVRLHRAFISSRYTSRMRGLWIVAVCACGRLGFEPPAGSDSQGSGSGSNDGGGSGSGAGDGGGSGLPTDAPMVDAQPAACANAFTLQFNVPYATSTCAGSNDRIDACGPATTNEVVFKFTAPSSGSYTIRARDAGTQNVSNSTGVVNASCNGTTQCVGVLGTPFTAGETRYFVIEASGGGCANIEFEAI